jgi:hypothetical protein
VLSVTIVRHSIHTAKTGQHHTHRQLGFCGSASFRLTGPSPKIAITAGSCAPLFTPSLVPRIDNTPDETSGEGR